MHTSPQPYRILLLGFGNVAQALLPLLASRQKWMMQELGIFPLISGIGTRHHGLFIHPQGIDASQFAQATQSLFYSLSPIVGDSRSVNLL